MRLLTVLSLAASSPPEAQIPLTVLLSAQDLLAEQGYGIGGDTTTGKAEDSSQASTRPVGHASRSDQHGAHGKRQLRRGIGGHAGDLRGQHPRHRALQPSS